MWKLIKITFLLIVIFMMSICTIAALTTSNAPTGRIYHSSNTVKIAKDRDGNTAMQVTRAQWRAKSGHHTNFCKGKARKPRLVTGTTMDAIICWYGYPKTATYLKTPDGLSGTLFQYENNFLLTFVGNLLVK